MVNVKDVKSEAIPTPTPEKDMLDLIFERQHGLAEKYLPIEKQNGLLQYDKIPVNLDDKKAQARLKDFAWRTLEELYEATDALIIHPDDPTHYIEEVIDALHFFTELNILCGYDGKTVKEFYSIPDGVDKLSFLAQLALQSEVFPDLTKVPPLLLIHASIGQPIGNAMNKLKNKPWKQTHMVTDEAAFRTMLMGAWIGFMRVLGNRSGLSAEQVFSIYFQKSEVNKFRIRSGY